MKKFIFVTFISQLLSLSVSMAKEVDNYIAWGHSLQDSGTHLDEYILSSLVKNLNIMKENNLNNSCENIVIKLVDNAFYSPGYQLSERWAEDSTEVDKYPPVETVNREDYYFESIYLKPRKLTNLSRVLKAHGVYFGSDKLGHFTSLGNKYYKRYLKYKKDGMKENEAIQKVIDYGIKTESGILGFIPSGVFSSGDLEANFQGFKFIKSLCSKNRGQLKLKKVNGDWKLINQENFSMSQYVHPNWDESYFQSYFRDSLWEDSVSKVLGKYCEKSQSQWVINLFNDYNKLKKGKTLTEKALEQYLSNDESRVVEHGLNGFSKICGHPVVSIPQAIPVTDSLNN